MKKYLVFLVICSTSILFSQSVKNVEKNQFRINILSPGVSNELGISNNSTLNFELTVLPVVETYFNDQISWALFPVIGAEYRYYTNFNRRIEKGKNIVGNSGNYLSFLNQAFITAPIAGNREFDEPVAYLGGFVYGLQRTYKSGFYFSSAVGPAFFTGDNDPTATIYIDARIGWVVGKKK